MEAYVLYINQQRMLLENLISLKRGNLLDPEVVKASQNLDALITKFYCLSLG